MRRFASVVATAAVVWYGAHGHAQKPSNLPSGRHHVSAKALISGREHSIHAALAAGAAATITLQPVQPTTIPPSSYPTGTTISGSTLNLTSVPARVWLEVHITGWAPEELKTVQARIAATDDDADGGGYFGENARCAGLPLPGAGDLWPALQPCTTNADCRAALSGDISTCQLGEPSRCAMWNGTGYFPAGRYCEPGFQNFCDPQWGGGPLWFTDYLSPSCCSLNFPYWWTVEPDSQVFDFQPTYLGTLVLDVPENAKGDYTIDFDETQTYFQDPQAQFIPVAAYNAAVIRTPCCDCETNADCDDGDACTVDSCHESCICMHAPAPGWNQATECCNPVSGVQAPIPRDTPCRIGGCSLGGSLGSPSYVNLADGTDCVPEDVCNLPGQCQAGWCAAEEYAGAECPKARFISFAPGADSAPKAYRVRLMSLHHPEPAYSGGFANDFSALEGQYRWVGVSTAYTESTSNPSVVHAAVMGCEPYFADWSAIGLLHVTGAEIVPSSMYEVRWIAEGLDIEEESNYSPPMTIATGRWGDVVFPMAPPSVTVQPDATDETALINKFSGTFNPVTKPRVLMIGPAGASIPDLANDVDFAQISAVVDAFRGVPYPFAAPEPCP